MAQPSQEERSPVLAKLLQALRNTRRRAFRVPRDQQAHLFAGVEPLGPVRLVDLSATGARVEMLRPVVDAAVTRLLVMESSQLLDVEAVWSRGPQLGLRVTGSHHLRGYTEGDAEQIKTWWIAHRLAGAD